MKKASVTESASTPIDIQPNKYVRRFLEKLTENKRTGCLEYKGALAPNGYGVFWDGTTSILSHRYAYDTFKADLPKDGVLAHSCNNKKCCNWDHLRPATHKENSADASRDGLLAVNRRSYVKASDTEIADIRSRSAKGESNYSIAKHLDRGEAYVGKVVSGKLHSEMKAAERAERAAKRVAAAVAKLPKKRGPKPASSFASTVLQEAA